MATACMAYQEATLMTSFEVYDGQKLSQVCDLKYSSTKAYLDLGGSQR